MKLHRKRIAVTWALALAALVESGCGVIRHVRPSNQRETYKFDPPFSVEDPQFRRSLDGMGSVMVGGNLAELLENGDGVFPAITKDIREAKTSVDVEVYIFKPDEAGRLFADAMIAAARTGVDVRLLVDAQGGRLGTLRKELEAAGVDCKVYRSARRYAILGRRTHRKLVIVDGKIGYTGGFGIDKRWLGNARDKTEWHDSSVRVTGPVVAQLQAIFSEDWTFTTGEILAGDASSLPKMLYFMAI